VAQGDASLLDDTFQLDVVGVPGDQMGLILRGSSGANGGLGLPAGDGLLCVTGSSERSQVQVASMGAVSFTDFHGQPFGASSFGPGNACHYQYWYRDPAGTCSGSGFNLSNGWVAVWLP
jgi:hypothetical protein